MDKEHFLSPDTFEEYYKPVFNKTRNYKLREVIQFLIVLPFELALSENSIISFLEENEIYCFSFCRQEKETSYSAGGKVDSKIPYYVTCVEMSLFTEKVYFLNEKLRSVIFDSMLKYLNYVIISYLIKTKQVDVYKISREMLEPSSLSRHLMIPEFKIKDEILFFLHLNLVTQKELIDMDKQGEIVQFTNVIKDQINPFILSEELMMSARRNIQLGFYKETIINAQTSIETLLRTLYMELLKIEGIPVEEIEKKQKVVGFITMVKKEFSTRIGGSWDVTNTRKEVGNWHENCYELRNRIIHGGYQPDYSETIMGIHSAQKLREYVVERLKRTPKFKVLTDYL
ncbi:hypothetical protein ACFCVU_04470 [Peribacillus butanolivorans]|uniref:hypothetical protein n=1 Tax=Peribacillus butanolivorans TaxID=421767 RepID=UPI0035D5C936